MPLMGIYALLLLVIVILYPFCRWVAGFKERHTEWWLIPIQIILVMLSGRSGLFHAGKEGGLSVSLS